ncbi:glutathione peroxidase [Rhodovulum sulfidophilum]|uniref:glutathione peroxidase n=1 Tax=Rhodovulum sulfidophilum TaxID=35806 RepID=UPI0019239822|nr:glutathione peroxidase [Rhodovulum sulfidophilum]MBL3559753.1 glutathione peroxidase [Rhodovulum sulfidophilum]
MRPATLPVVAALFLGAGSATAAESFRFPSIDGGEIDLAAFRGRPVLVVNTASQCGFTPQYDGLQALQDSYGPRGLVVLAVPSDDFNQELADETAVKDFCEVNFGLTLPMTEITHVKGAEAHPFYRWMDAEHDFSPSWNFNKVLLDGSGNPVATFGSFTKPQSAKLTAKIETLLPQ